jgi:hypothetical protein
VVLSGPAAPDSPDDEHLYRLLEDSHCTQLQKDAAADNSQAAPVFGALADVCLAIKGLSTHVDWAAARAAAAFQLTQPTCLESAAQHLLAAVVTRHHADPGSPLTFGGAGSGPVCPVSIDAVTVVAESGSTPYLLVQGPYLFEVHRVYVGGQRQDDVTASHQGGSYCGEIRLPVPPTVTVPAPSSAPPSTGAPTAPQLVAVRVVGRGYDVMHAWEVDPAQPFAPDCAEPSNP